MATPKLTRSQRANLTKLADYLETLPKSYRHFDMGTFFDRGDFASEDEVNYALHNGGVQNCGTSACAVGHGPSAGILMPKSLIKEGWYSSRPDWDAYSEKFVGSFQLGTPGRRFFDFMFGGEWDRVDNHHYGAAARIRFVLDKGYEGIPSEFGNLFFSPERKHRKVYRDYDKRYRSR